jgi:hypothetical protein
MTASPESEKTPPYQPQQLSSVQAFSLAMATRVGFPLPAQDRAECRRPAAQTPALRQIDS